MAQLHCWRRGSRWPRTSRRPSPRRCWTSRPAPGHCTRACCAIICARLRGGRAGGADSQVSAFLAIKLDETGGAAIGLVEAWYAGLVAQRVHLTLACSAARTQRAPDTSHNGIICRSASDWLHADASVGLSQTSVLVAAASDKLQLLLDYCLGDVLDDDAESVLQLVGLPLLPLGDGSVGTIQAAAPSSGKHGKAEQGRSTAEPSSLGCSLMPVLGYRSCVASPSSALGMSALACRQWHK